nr:MAG TPA: hypothetical protein [Caudoviricetes sp.]
MFLINFKCLIPIGISRPCQAPPPLIHVRFAYRKVREAVKEETAIIPGQSKKHIPMTKGCASCLIEQSTQYQLS